jgi:hypothetical protein
VYQPRPRLRGVATISDRPARIGKLKIGEKTLSKSGKEIPTKLDYIKAVDGAGNTIQVFHDVFGDRPTEFRAVFPSNDPIDFYWEAYRRYGSGTGLVCHGDGRQAIVEETGETIECPCGHAEPTQRDGREYPPACKPVASLSLFLFDVPALGVFQIDTGSLNSIKNLRWFIQSLPGLTGGQYAGIPFKVKVEPFQAMHDGKASVAYQWKLDLLPGYRPMDLRMAAAQAVESFLLPPDLAPRPLLDEAKPEDLYVGLPAPAESSESGHADYSDITETFEAPQSGPPDDALAAETAYRNRLEVSTIPPAKKQAAIAVMEANRVKAAEMDTWAAYQSWLQQATERIPA